MIRNIANVALYESKTLYRSWFFRIFSILALFILFGLNSGFFGNHMGARWTTRAIAANIPYINVLFINVAQAIIAVFLASDFLRRDKKLDTTEVIYARPITNGEYVVGKTAGILVLFVGLVVLALGMALVFNLVRQDVPVVWEAYLWYPLLISIPTMVFILGLSFFLMILFRSQAVTFLVLLGYIGLTLFYFQDKAYGLLDYMAFNLPMVYSDFIGFSSPRLILLHRIAYLMMGLGFIFATIRFLNRLPQTGRWNLLNLGGFVVFLAGGLGLGFLFFQEHVQARTDREESIELNNRYADMPPVDVVSTDLRVVQMGEDLDVRAVLEFRNPERNMLDTLVFSLNPGFRIDSLTLDGAEPSWERRAQLILVAQEMSPGARGRLDLHYRGKADPSLAFLDVPREQRDALKRIQVAPLNKDPGFGRSGYQLLTPELFWYPMAGVGFNLYTFLPRSPDYVTFRLDVEPGPGLIPVAPGRADSTARGWSFRPEQDLNAFPLLMGPFEKKSLDVDGIPVELYIKPDHDFFSSFFTHSADTLAALVRSAWDDYEIDELDLYYPFPRVRLVEVPIQYHAYERPTSQVVDYVFPELILLPEKGAGLNTLDFARDLRFEERRDRERETARTEREIEVDQFKRFLQNTFFQTSSTTGRGGFGFGGEEERDELITFQGGSSYSGNPFSAFPLYYNYMTTIPSREYPMLNAMVELYLKNGFEVSPRQGFEGGITDKERANLALKEKPMLAWFADYNTDLTASLIEQTGSYVISSLKNRVGSADFDNFLYYYVEDHAFMDVRFEEFARDFRRDFGLDIRPYLESMGSGGGLASFLVSEPEYIQTRDDLGDVYLVKFHISNTGDARGLLDATFRIMGSGGFGGGSGPTTETRL
ncbi:MAG: ABC transporter permease, partial [Bacteroidales bacterium]